MKARGKTKVVEGFVTSDRMDKTVVVEVQRLVPHVKYGKYLRRKSVFRAHDARNEAHVGDKVQIEEARPLSRTKSWRLVRILRRGGA